GTFDLVVSDGVGLQLVDVFVERLDRLDRALTLCADHYADHAGVIEGCADSAAHGVRETTLGTDVLDQARREGPTAKGLIENLNRVVVGIVALRTEFDSADIGLVHILFDDLVVAGLGRLELDVFFLGRRTLRPGSKRFAQLGLKSTRVEVATNTQDDVV